MAPPMGEHVDLTHHFLIAMPAMADPRFAQSLAFICEHTPEGAIAIVVNKPVDMTVAMLLRQIEVVDEGAVLEGFEAPVLQGGPVQSSHGFVLHRPLGNWQSTLAVSDDIGLTTSKDVLEAVARGDGPSDIIVSLGYAGWSAGQLEDELAANAWLTVEADADVIFGLPPEQRLTAAMGLLGFDFGSLSGDVGHA